jgi:hypothetical protein
MTRKVARFLSFAFVLLSAIAVHAQTTRGEIFFIGTATGQGAFGSADLTFRLWNAYTGGTYLNYADSQSGVPINPDDSFFAVLGAGTGGDVPANLFAANPSMFVAVELTSTPGVEIGPRAPLFSGAYAQNAASLGKASSVSLIKGTISLDASTGDSGNVLKGGELFMHTSGTQNTFLGSNAGNLTTSGTGRNTAVGFQALLANADGYENTALGASALSRNTSGFNNTATGDHALRDNVTGTENTAIGHGALASNLNCCNTATGSVALINNTSGLRNTASGFFAMASNTSGSSNTSMGVNALRGNTTGSANTAIGDSADVSVGNLFNATAIGFGAVVNASNKIRLGNAQVTVVEGPVAYTFTSDKNKKENFKPVDGEAVLEKIRGLPLTSWNYIGHDPKQFRHYGPMAQDFFAAFGNDGVGTIGTSTTINSGDIAGVLMIAVQALEKRTADLISLGAENEELKARIEALEER